MSGLMVDGEPACLASVVVFLLFAVEGVKDGWFWLGEGLMWVEVSRVDWSGVGEG